MKNFTDRRAYEAAFHRHLLRYRHHYALFHPKGGIAAVADRGNLWRRPTWRVYPFPGAAASSHLHRRKSCLEVAANSCCPLVGHWWGSPTVEIHYHYCRPAVVGKASPPNHHRPAMRKRRPRKRSFNRRVRARNIKNSSSADTFVFNTWKFF